jgi:hypothetical protein
MSARVFECECCHHFCWIGQERSAKVDGHYAEVCPSCFDKYRTGQTLTENFDDGRYWPDESDWDNEILNNK